MLKVLLLLALVAIGIWMLTTKSRIARRQDKPTAPRNAAEAGTGSDPQAMVRCAHCGTHVPESETVTKNNRLLCNNPECSKF